MQEAKFWRLAAAFLIGLLLILVSAMVSAGISPADAAAPLVTRFGSVTIDHTLNVDGSATLNGTIEAVAAVDLDSTLNVDGASTLTGAVTTGGRVTVGTIFGLTPSTLNITVTQDSYITPTNTLQKLTSAGTVSTASIAAGTAGDTVRFLNTGSQSIVLSDTGTLKLSGNLTLTGDDTVCLLSNGTNWYQFTAVVAN